MSFSNIHILNGLSIVVAFNVNCEVVIVDLIADLRALKMNLEAVIILLI